LGGVEDLNRAIKRICAFLLAILLALGAMPIAYAAEEGCQETDADGIVNTYAEDEPAPDVKMDGSEAITEDSETIAERSDLELQQIVADNMVSMLSEPGVMYYEHIELPSYRYDSLTSDDVLSFLGTYGKGYSFHGEAGHEVTITLSSYDFDAYLFLMDDNKEVLIEDDDGGGYPNSLITYTLPYTGIYYIQATQFAWPGPGDVGIFYITIETREIIPIEYRPKTNLPTRMACRFWAPTARAIAFTARPVLK
jgi:hypothetical protein